MLKEKGFRGYMCRTTHCEQAYFFSKTKRIRRENACILCVFLKPGCSVACISSWMLRNHQSYLRSNHRQASGVWNKPVEHSHVLYGTTKDLRVYQNKTPHTLVFTTVPETCLKFYICSRKTLRAYLNKSDEIRGVPHRTWASTVFSYRFEEEHNVLLWFRS